MALVAWCSSLLDQGYRGEMECIIAKIFGSESQKEAAIELFMKTHGGRSFLHGHMFGDHVHEFLAPCIYEGEGEMLGMGFFKSLIKEHGKTYFEPISVLAGLGVRQPNPLNPACLGRRKTAGRLCEVVPRREPDSQRPSATSVDAVQPGGSVLRFAIDGLQRSRMEISAAMRTHQLRLADRQCRMSELSSRIQDLVVMLTTSLWASRQSSEVVRSAADILCQDLDSQAGTSDDDRPTRISAAVTKLGEMIEA